MLWIVTSKFIGSMTQGLHYIEIEPSNLFKYNSFVTTSSEFLKFIQRSRNSVKSNIFVNLLHKLITVIVIYFSLASSALISLFIGCTPQGRSMTRRSIVEEAKIQLDFTDRSTFWLLQILQFKKLNQIHNKFSR